MKPIIHMMLPKEQAEFWHGRSTVDQITHLTQKIVNSFFGQKEGWHYVCQFHSSLQYCMALQPYLQATLSSGQTHGLIDYGICL